jgi:hypothetical protein
MTTMRRLRVSWDGLGGLPGLSTFYYGVASPNVSDCVAFFTALKAFFPSSLTWTIPSNGDEIDSATGALTGVWTGSGGGTVTANVGTGPYAAGTGLRVRWNTGIIHNGRRVLGSSFLVPAVTSVYSSSGVIVPANQTSIQTAASAFVASGVAKGIWSKGRSLGDGLYCAMSSATVPNAVTSLRSRRV